MQSGNHWLGFGPEFKRGTTIWDLASEWGKKKAGDVGAQMIMTAMGGPSAGMAYEAGKELLPNMLTHMLKKGGSVQYKEGGGPAWGEDPLFIEWTNLYNDKNLGIIEPNDPRLLELETILMEKYGGQTHVYKNHGGMLAGPLSEVKYKKTGGNVSDEITLKMAPLSNKGE